MRKLPENVARLAPGKTPIAVLHDRFGGVAQLVARRNKVVVTNWLCSVGEFDGPLVRQEPDWCRSRALAMLEKLPGREVLGEQHEALREAVYEPASETEARAILGLMLEGIPAAASGATVAYGDALAFAVCHVDDDRDPDEFPKWRGFSGAVLFATVRRIWEKSTFTPSIAEVLEIARKVRAEHYAAFSTTNRLLALRMNAEDVVADTEPVAVDACADPDAIPF
jgi:hypothetical protein